MTRCVLLAGVTNLVGLGYGESNLESEPPLKAQRRDVNEYPRNTFALHVSSHRNSHVNGEWGRSPASARPDPFTHVAPH